MTVSIPARRSLLMLMVEGTSLLLCVGFGIAWVFDPDGSYEPWTYLFGLVTVVLEFFRRNSEHTGQLPQALPIAVADTHGVVPDAKKLTTDSEQPFLDSSESTSLFAERFSQAFPGIREVKWFDGRTAVERLSILLKEPLRFRTHDGFTEPIWWWRDGNMPISQFRVLSPDVVLLDGKELRLGRVAAVPFSSSWRNFVYLEALPMLPCGAYEWTEEKKQQWVRDHGYAWEEYGLYKGHRAVSRAEYDDDAAVIMGVPVKLGRDVELRERYITPFNLVIAPHGSPINNPSFDEALCSMMNKMLRKQVQIDELADRVGRLPRR